MRRMVRASPVAVEVAVWVTKAQSHMLCFQNLNHQILFLETGIMLFVVLFSKPNPSYKEPMVVVYNTLKALA